jgi:hypothetical protein
MRPIITFFAGYILAAALFPAHAQTCAALRAFNDRQPSRAAMEPLPCRCVPMSERFDRVYSVPPSGMTCGNGLFCDKHGRQGLSCSKL